MHYLYQNQINETELDFPSSTSTSQLNLKIYVDFSFTLWHTHIQVCQIPLTKLQEPQALKTYTVVQTITLWKQVDADSKEEAKEIAVSMPLPNESRDRVVVKEGGLE